MNLQLKKSWTGEEILYKTYIFNILNIFNIFNIRLIYLIIYRKNIE